MEILEELNPQVQMWQIMQELVGEYSAGQKKKILLAKSLCERTHLYVWDEPLNYIDILSRRSGEITI